MYSVSLRFDSSVHKDLSWGGWVCRCVHMSVIVQEGMPHWDCQMFGESFLLPVNLPPLLFTLTPFIPMLRSQHEDVVVCCSAVTPAKRLPHQACGPQCWPGRLGILWGPRAR